MSMKVSVIIPVYNVVDYVDRCISSVVSQTHNDLEVIIVDDGSIDGSRQKCEAWIQKDDRIILITQENQGVSVARNKGLEMASGDFIAFVDGDDYLDSMYIESMLEPFSEDVNVEIVFCGYRYDDNGIVSEYGFFEKDCVFDRNDSEKLISRAIGVYDNNIKRKTHIGTPWAKIYKTCFIKENHIFFEPGMPRMQDLIFNIKCFKLLSKGIYINKSLYTYVRRPESTANNYNAKYELDAVQIIDCLNEVTEGLSEKVNEAVKYKAVLLLIEAIRLKYSKKECKLSLLEKRKEISKMSKTEPFESALSHNYCFVSNSFGRNLFLMFMKLRMYLLAYVLVIIKYKGK